MFLDVLETDKKLSAIDIEIASELDEELDFLVVPQSVSLPAFGSAKPKLLQDLKDGCNPQIARLAELSAEKFSRTELSEKTDLTAVEIDEIEDTIARLERWRDETRFWCLFYPIVTYTSWVAGNAPDLVKVLFLIALAIVSVKLWQDIGDMSFLYKKSCRIRYEAELRYLGLRAAMILKEEEEE